MYLILEKTAGDFIDLENYLKIINDEDEKEDVRNEIADKFLLLLLGRKPDVQEVSEVIEMYLNEVSAIKNRFFWIYNKPDVPSDSTQKETTAGDEYRNEFAEDYGGYVELIYLIATVYGYKPNEVLQMKCEDFLFWGEYLSRKRFVENIK